MRKQKLIFLLFPLIIFACNKNAGKTAVSPTDTTKIEFYTYKYDFDTILQGEEIIYTFVFKNIGDKPYVVKHVYTTCGCTVPYVSTKPVKPGEEGFIKVKFSSAGKIGTQHKEIYIEGNTNPSRIKLELTGYVKIPVIVEQTRKN